MSLLDYDEPENKYIAFETFMKDGLQKSTSKSIYILHVNNQERHRFGRSHDVEFHIEDISVSRIHGEILITQHKVLINDIKSKFGTQILNKTASSLSKKDFTKNMFQIGRTWFMLSYQAPPRKFGCFSCLCGKPVDTSLNNTVFDNEVDDENHNFLDKRMLNQLEINIEKLQKDRDSVFNLDESFYNKLVDLYINDEEGEGPKQTSAACLGNETIDEDRREVSKSDDPVSSSNYNSEENDNSGSEPRHDYSVPEESSEDIDHGIGTENKRSSMISKCVPLTVQIPK